MAKVSVLMPVFNTKENYLRANIESILNQSFADFEFLILDDASKPYIEEVVKSYADSRIKYFKNEQNLGISKSRNKLLELATGEYLAIVDHDDISLPERFAKQVAVLDNDSSVGVVSGLFEKINKRGAYRFSKFSTNLKKKIRAQDQEINSKHMTKLNLFSGCLITHPLAMIRKKVLTDNNICYEQEYFPAEDYALWCRLVPFTEFYVIPEVLLYYRVHESNTFKSNESVGNNAAFKIRSFVARDNPELFAEYLSIAAKNRTIRLFGFIPLLKIERRNDFMNIYLFELILLFRLKLKIRIL